MSSAMVSEPVGFLELAEKIFVAPGVLLLLFYRCFLRGVLEKPGVS
jgi:hypothetical protein